MVPLRNQRREVRVVCSMRNTLRGRKTEIRLFDSVPWGTPRGPPLLFPEE